MSSKAEWVFLAVLFAFAVVSTVLFPPSTGIEESDSSGGLVEAYDGSTATEDSFLIKP